MQHKSITSLTLTFRNVMSLILFLKSSCFDFNGNTENNYCLLSEVWNHLMPDFILFKLLKHPVPMERQNISAIDKLCFLTIVVCGKNDHGYF